MTDLSIATREELAHRSSDGMEVTLVWVHGDGEDKAVVCVCDRREGAYFEISTERYLALDVYYHPYAYRDFSAVDYEYASCWHFEQTATAFRQARPGSDVGPHAGQRVQRLRGTSEVALATEPPQ